MLTSNWVWVGFVSLLLEDDDEHKLDLRKRENAKTRNKGGLHDVGKLIAWIACWGRR